MYAWYVTLFLFLARLLFVKGFYLSFFFFFLIVVDASMHHHCNKCDFWFKKNLDHFTYFTLSCYVEKCLHKNLFLFKTIRFERDE